MLRLLIDTCVWLDIAKDYRHQPTLSALEQMIEAGEVSLVLPKQTADEFVRNKDRIIKVSGKSLSGTFRRVKEAVRQFGREDGKAETLANLDDVDHRITILGEAVNGSIQRIEKIFARADLMETSEAVTLRAAELPIGVKTEIIEHKPSTVLHLHDP
jgi:hypothetical protein